MFREIDKDGKGGISRSELAKGLNTIGLELTDTELSSVFEVADTNGDNHIVLKEFMDCIEVIITTCSEL